MNRFAYSPRVVRLLAGAVLAGGLAIASSAWAATYKVGRVVVTGNKSISTAALMAAVQEHRGSIVSEADILADRDAIVKVMTDAHVVGVVNVSISTLSGLSKVTFAIDDHGISTPTSTNVVVAPKLDAQTFEGNVLLTNAALIGASGLMPGEDLSDARIATAGKAILAAYGAIKSPVGVSISVETRTLASGDVDLIWHIDELRSRVCTSSNLDLCNNPFK